jgi:NADH-quinone oxidoreductase subunit N
MYFDEPKVVIDPVPEFGLRAALAVSSLYMVLFCLLPAPVISAAARAAQTLFQVQ